jgi:hypothetical protein
VSFLFAGLKDIPEDETEDYEMDEDPAKSVSLSVTLLPGAFTPFLAISTFCSMAFSTLSVYFPTCNLH